MPGVDAASLRVVSKRDVVIVVGAKIPVVSVARQVSFHLVEREYGRFARAVRLHAAVDIGRARAVLADGELRVTLPRLADRRGQEREIPIDVVPPGAAR
jgi:HSP20 family protein